MSDTDLISISEYAAMHDVQPQTIKKKCQINGFKTARKIGRNWVIDKNEPYTDNRVTSGKYRNRRKKDN